MIRRINMQQNAESKPLLVLGLQQEIGLGKLEHVQASFAALEKTNYPYLQARNEQGHTLLHLALINNSTSEITLFLLEKIQEQAANVIFWSDNQEHTLLWFAVKANFLDVVQELILYAHMSDQDDWIWLGDNQKNTPLHVAAMDGDHETIKLLLDTLADEESALNRLNLINNKGCTALFLLYQYLHSNSQTLSGELKSVCYNAIGMLIRKGADLSILTNALDSALDLHCQLPFEAQEAILRVAINRENKQSKDYFIELYESFLDRHPDVESAQKIYFRYINALRQPMTLFDMMKAHHQYNAKIPLRTTFNKLTSVEEDFAVIDVDENNKQKKGKEKVPQRDLYTEVETPIPEWILEQMPKYVEKLGLIEPITRSPMQFFAQKVISPQKSKNFDIFEDNRFQIASLIRDLEMYPGELELNTPSYSFRHRVLAIGVPLSILALTAALSIYFGLCVKSSQDEFHQAEKKHAPDDKIDSLLAWNIMWTILLIIETICGSSLFLISLSRSSPCWNRMPNISINQSDIYLRLNNFVTALAHLENDSLPTDLKKVAALKAEMGKLAKPCTLFTTQASLDKILKILKEIQIDMNVINEKTPLLIDSPAQLQINIA